MPTATNLATHQHSRMAATGEPEPAAASHSTKTQPRGSPNQKRRQSQLQGCRAADTSMGRGCYSVQHMVHRHCHCTLMLHNAKTTDDWIRNPYRTRSNPMRTQPNLWSPSRATTAALPCLCLKLQSGLAQGTQSTHRVLQSRLTQQPVRNWFAVPHSRAKNHTSCRRLKAGARRPIPWCETGRRQRLKGAAICGGNTL